MAANGGVRAIRPQSANVVERCWGVRCKKPAKGMLGGRTQTHDKERKL